MTYKVYTTQLPIWTIGWLFTIGFSNLSFWQGILAIFIWPYYIGSLFMGRI